MNMIIGLIEKIRMKKILIGICGFVIINMKSTKELK